MLDHFDKKLLNVLQTGLPIAERPFAVLAEQLDSDEDTVLERIQALRDRGYIRRIGSFFDSEKLGYKGTLVALCVKSDKMQEVASFVNRYPGVTHNYEREGEYNLWFTLLTPNEESKKHVLDEVRCREGVIALMDLASKRKYKINVQFKLG
ncbi:siroheme decarboxylase subunit alpha [Selenomonas sp. TAMA-11512]|uniref:siroheme decarboxylase subunit alpha n=1 Tax=Selenomonas sp. TAMA-11512 TaxID=3095337 RepID=UPI003087DD17|nr:siroheme decarboxylase subunit alpha [Selenomonas sp. TAMA-11512]